MIGSSALLARVVVVLALAYQNLSDACEHEGTARRATRIYTVKAHSKAEDLACAVCAALGRFSPHTWRQIPISPKCAAVKKADKVLPDSFAGQTYLDRLSVGCPSFILIWSLYT